MRSALKLTRMDYAGAVGFLAYSWSAVVTPICLLAMAEDLRFSLAGGGAIDAVRTLIVLIVLLGSGFAAARWGKVAVLGVGSLVLAVGMFLYALAPVHAAILAAMVLVGTGGGLLEGLINPLVQDSHPNDSGRYLNFVNAFWSVGVLSSVLIVGELLTRGVSWRTLMAFTGLMGVAATILFFLWNRRSGAVPAADVGTATMAHVLQIVKRRRFWVFAAAIFFGGGAEAGFTFWSASYIQLHYGALARAGGIGTASFAAGMILGRMGSGHFVRQKGLRNLILFSALIGIVISLFVFVVQSLLGFYVLLFFAGLSVACFWPSIQSYAADVLAVDSTMLFILLSCAGIPGFGSASWIMGIIGDAATLRVSFAVIPVYFVLLLVIIVVESVSRGSRRIQTPT